MIRRYQAGSLAVEVHPSKAALGRAAAADAAAVMREAIRLRGRARIIVGTGPSQNDTIAALAREDLDWRQVEVFHMDEYVGIQASHPASFRRWLRTHLADLVTPGIVHYVSGDAADPEAECARYAAALRSCERVAGQAKAPAPPVGQTVSSAQPELWPILSQLLTECPIDVCFLGFGENGHIAFNDPHEARFDDPVAVKIVTLDERCRAQQVGEGHFTDIASVPPRAITLTCPTLMAARRLVASVPDRRKAEAVRSALEGTIGENCPASIVRTHPSAALYLEPESAARLAST